MEGTPGLGAGCWVLAVAGLLGGQVQWETVEVLAGIRDGHVSHAYFSPSVLMAHIVSRSQHFATKPGSTCSSLLITLQMAPSLGSELKPAGTIP